MNFPLKQRLLPFAMLSLVAGCGGGSTDGGIATVAPPVVAADTAGQVVNSYISGATVTLDANDDGICASNEPQATTDSRGGYRFAGMGAHLVCAVGGTNMVTGLPFVGKLLAPAGATVVTPLSTLVVAQVMSALPAPAPGRAAPLDPASVAAAQSRIASQLGLPAGVPFLTTDPVALMTRAGATLADTKLEQSNAAVQVLLQHIAISIIGSANLPPSANTAATNEAFIAASKGLQQALTAVGAAPVDLGSASAAQVDALVGSAATRAAAAAKSNQALLAVSPAFATLSPTNVGAAISASPVGALARSVAGASVASLTTRGGAETVALSTPQIAELMKQIAPLLTEDADAGAASVAALKNVVEVLLPANGSATSRSAAEAAIAQAIDRINGALPAGRPRVARPSIELPAPVVVPGRP